MYVCIYVWIVFSSKTNLLQSGCHSRAIHVYSFIQYAHSIYMGNLVRVG